MNNCVKVSVVVVNKHAQRDLLFDERSRSKCHLTECFWELPWSVFVTMETDKQWCFFFFFLFFWFKQKEKKKQSSSSVCKGSQGWSSILSALSLSISPPRIHLNVFSALLCLLFCLSAWRMVIFDTAQLWHYNQHFPPTQLPTRNVSEKQIELLGDLNFNIK